MALFYLTGSLSLLAAAALLWLAAHRLVRHALAERAEPSAALPAGDNRADYYVRLETRLLGQGRQLWRRQAHRRPWFAEFSLLLRQAGHIGTRAQLVVVGSLLALLLLLFVAGLSYGLQQGRGPASASLLGVAGVLLGSVVEWLWLKRALARRTARLDEEMETLVQVTRMLWDTGMTLEGVLKGLIRTLEPVAPESVRELRLVLQRIEAGQDREEVLEELAELQRCAGLHDLYRLLAQVSGAGGGARRSLLALSELLRDRRRTRIQEAVTKLSGKMSLVMMLFLFPALLIVLAGPAVINLGGLFEALGN